MPKSKSHKKKRQPKRHRQFARAKRAALQVFAIISRRISIRRDNIVAGAGHHATAGAEQAILAGLVSVALAMLVAVVLLLMGLRRSLAPSPVRATA